MGRLMTRHEAHARAAKVAAMARLLPPAPRRWHARRLAARLSRFTPDERARWAQAAGVNAPSSTTWAWLVAALREAVI